MEPGLEDRSWLAGSVTPDDSLNVTYSGSPGNLTADLASLEAELENLGQQPPSPHESGGHTASTPKTGPRPARPFVTTEPSKNRESFNDRFVAKQNGLEEQFERLQEQAGRGGEGTASLAAGANEAHLMVAALAERMDRTRVVATATTTRTGAGWGKVVSAH